MSVVAAIKEKIGLALGIHEVGRADLTKWLGANHVKTSVALAEFQRIMRGAAERDRERIAARRADQDALARRFDDEVQRGQPIRSLPVDDTLTNGEAFRAWTAKWGSGDALLIDPGRAALIAVVLQRRYASEGEPEGLVALRKQLRSMGEKLAELEGQRRALCRQWALQADYASPAETKAFDDRHGELVHELETLRRKRHELGRSIYDDYGTTATR